MSEEVALQSWHHYYTIASLLLTEDKDGEPLVMVGTSNALNAVWHRDSH